MNFIGQSEVPGSKGMENVKLALQKLKFSRHIKRSEGTKPPKVDLSISINTVEVIDSKTKLHLHRIPLHRISYCADDKKDKNLFAFIAKHDDGKHFCYGFDSSTLAYEITLTIGQAFELAYEKYLKTSPLSPALKKKELEKTTAADMSKRVKELEEENKQLREKIRQLELNHNNKVAQENTRSIQSRPLPQPSTPSKLQQKLKFNKNFLKKMGTTSSKNNPSAQSNYDPNSRSGARFAKATPDYDVFKTGTQTHTVATSHNVAKPSLTKKLDSDSGGELYANLEDIISTLKNMMDNENNTGKKHDVTDSRQHEQQINGRQMHESSSSDDRQAVPSNTPNESMNLAPNIEELLKQHKMLMEAILQKHLLKTNQSVSTGSLSSSQNAASTESYVFDTLSLDSGTPHIADSHFGTTDNKYRDDHDLVHEYDNITRTLKELCGEEGYMILARKNDELLKKQYEGTYVDNMYESVATLMEAVRESSQRSNQDFGLENIVAKHSSVVMPSKQKNPGLLKKLQTPRNKPAMQPLKLPEPMERFKKEKQKNIYSQPIRKNPRNKSHVGQRLSDDYSIKFSNPGFCNSSSSLTTDSGSYTFSPSTASTTPQFTPINTSLASLWGPHVDTPPSTMNIWSHPTHYTQQHLSNSTFTSPSYYAQKEPFSSTGAEGDPFHMQPFIPPRSTALAMPPKMSPSMRKTQDLFDVTASPATTRKNYMDAREGFDRGLAFGAGEFTLDDFDPLANSNA